MGEPLTARMMPGKRSSMSMYARLQLQALVAVALFPLWAAAIIFFDARHVAQKEELEDRAQLLGEKLDLIDADLQEWRVVTRIPPACPSAGRFLSP